ncbi:MAG: DinB family protein [Flavitalea sp.]
MNQHIENILKTRLYILDQIKDLSVDQLNKMPEGMGNNIVWNLGHIVAAAQGSCYFRSGVPMIINDTFWNTYKPGSRPEHFIDKNEIEVIKQLLISSMARFQEDYQNNIFSGYKTWTSRYGVEMQNIDDAIRFLMFHEGYHGGAISVLKKLVIK